jgi:hypothetical protein
MKCELTSLFLFFVLGVLAVVGVFFGSRTVFFTHEFRSLSTQANTDNNNLLQVRALVNDVGLYNQKSPSPELTKLLQTLQVKPVNH